ncbi:MAG: CDP-alcohol phosphatidyltransferase family protein [Actinobacteria bacterium]|nr:CDP-alcohol phosphatidyltransferase family protein [Actinomycetota bacterium]
MTAVLGAGLVLAGGGLVALSFATAVPPSSPVPDLAGYLVRWRRLHGGYDPRANPWLWGWLAMSYRIARPLARRGVRPDVLTLWTVWLALAVLVPAAAGGRWQILAGWLLVASGLGDTLDGCVAALTNRATRWGYVLDSLVDRVNDVVYLLAVVVVGGAGVLALVAGVCLGLLEYLRARAANVGMGDVGVVTVGERATRVILCAAAIGLGGVFTRAAPLVASGGLAALAVASAAGLAQLGVAVHRGLGAGRRY